MIRKPLRQIVALGGGMFSMEPHNGLLDKYILDLVPKKRPKICFMGTASSDGKEYRDMFYEFFNKQQCEPSHLSFLDPPKNLEKFILDKDIIHVGGGNTKLIMDKWKETGVDKIMRKAWAKGVILTGMSAGAICWFNDGITNPSKGVLTRLPCLGLLQGSFCPHYDDRAELKTAYHKLILEEVIGEGYGVEDGAAVHFVGAEQIRVVTSRPGVSAFKVKKVKNKITEVRLDSYYLGRESDIEAIDKEKSEQTKQIGVLNTVISFIEKINDQDIDGIVRLLSDDHKFTDSMGIVVNSKKEMKNAWKLYFKWFPDYEISIKNTLLTDDSVGIFGIAKGTFDTDELTPSDKFEIPAAWRAKVKNNLITEWQVFADNEVVRDIIKSNGMKSMIKEKVKFLHSLRD